MRKFIATLFNRESHTELAKDQLFEAERLHLEHQAAGELHSGLAAIYKMRADRLRVHATCVARLAAAK